MLDSNLIGDGMQIFFPKMYLISDRQSETVYPNGAHLSLIHLFWKSLHITIPQSIFLRKTR